MTSLNDVLALARPRLSPHQLVRIGPRGDGGYLLPNDLEGISACISPGVANETRFDYAIAQRGMDVIMCDANMASAGQMTAHHERFRKIKKNISAEPSPGTVTLSELCANVNGDLLLQMDIEGAEYKVLTNAPSELLSRFRIMSLEVHDVQLIFSVPGSERFAALLEKLNEHHQIVHIHPNNWSPISARGNLIIPNTLEFTFQRKDRGEFAEHPGPFPHRLDSSNSTMMPDIPLPSCWWKETKLVLPSSDVLTFHPVGPNETGWSFKATYRDRWIGSITNHVMGNPEKEWSWQLLDSGKLKWADTLEEAVTALSTNVNCTALQLL